MWAQKSSARVMSASESHPTIQRSHDFHLSCCFPSVTWHHWCVSEPAWQRKSIPHRNSRSWWLQRPAQDVSDVSDAHFLQVFPYDSVRQIVKFSETVIFAGPSIERKCKPQGFQSAKCYTMRRVLGELRITPGATHTCLGRIHEFVPTPSTIVLVGCPATITVLIGQQEPNRVEQVLIWHLPTSDNELNSMQHHLPRDVCGCNCRKKSRQSHSQLNQLKLPWQTLVTTAYCFIGTKALSPFMHDCLRSNSTALKASAVVSSKLAATRLWKGLECGP